MMKRTVIALAIFGAFAFAAESHAGMDFNIRISDGPSAAAVVVHEPPPPTVVVEEAPEMVFVPETGVYVAVGTPQDLFFISGRYYYQSGGNWYASRGGYGGPWTHVEYRRIPPGLRRYKIERIHEFREREWHDYHDRGHGYGRKHFRAERGDDEGRGRGRGHGEHGDRHDEGRGRGHGEHGDRHEDRD
jgi:hypothetical protein